MVGLILAFCGHKLRKPIDFFLGFTLCFFFMEVRDTCQAPVDRPQKKRGVLRSGSEPPDKCKQNDVLGMEIYEGSLQNVRLQYFAVIS